MMGKPGLLDQKGLIPRSLEQVFQTKQMLEAQGWKYEMQVRMNCGLFVYTFSKNIHVYFGLSCLHV